MKYCYVNSIYAAFHNINFDESTKDSVKITLRLTKRNGYFQKVDLSNIVFHYNIGTQTVLMDEETLSPSVIHDRGSMDALCTFVKSNMDAVFSDSEESEKHLLEILCMGEGIVLGEHAMFYKPMRYGLSYEDGRYLLEITKCGGGLAMEERKTLDHKLSNSVLKSNLAAWLYYLTVRDSSFLNQKYMVKRERAKRRGTIVVRECQSKLENALMKAEKYAGRVNAYSREKGRGGLRGRNQPEQAPNEMLKV